MALNRYEINQTTSFRQPIRTAYILQRTSITGITMNKTTVNLSGLKLVSIFALLMASAAQAQLSDYHKTYLKHAKIVKTYHSYIDEFGVYINSPPPEIEQMVQSLGVVYALLNDDIEADFEPEARIDFNQSVVQNLINDYPVLQQKIDKSINQIAKASDSDKPLDAGDENELARIRLAIEHNYFALPMVMFTEKTPYDDMYRQVLDAYQLYINGPGGQDLTDLEFYQAEDFDFGSTQILSVTQRNEIKAAERQAKKDALIQDQADFKQQVKSQAATENAAFIKKANEQAAQARKDAEMLFERAGQDAQGSGWLMWLLCLLLLFTGLWFFREKLPPPLKKQVEPAGQKVISMAQSIFLMGKNHIEQWRKS